MGDEVREKLAVEREGLNGGNVHFPSMAREDLKRVMAQLPRILCYVGNNLLLYFRSFGAVYLGQLVGDT